MKELKREEGVSKIVLVIVAAVLLVAVRILLKVMVMDDTTDIIQSANYSKFSSNVLEVENAITVKKREIKELELSKGSEITDAQIYNYIAKGGTSEADFLEDAQVPDYTIIDESADLGIKLPEIKVYYTSKNEGEIVKYAITKYGDLFIWPPYEYDNEYYINGTIRVDKDLIKKNTKFTVSIYGKNINIRTDANGKLANASENSASSNGSTPINSKGNSETSVLKVGDYVNYSPATKTITTDTSKTGYTDSQTLTTEAGTQWRIFNIDETTGEVLLTTQGATNTDTNVYLQGATGYLHGAEELNRLCKELYSSETLTARSMTIEDLDKAVGYGPTKYNKYGKEYEFTSGTFYTYEENGNTVTSETPKIASDSNKVKVKNTDYLYLPILKNTTVSNILGSSLGWLASSCVYVDSSIARFYVCVASSSVMGGPSLLDSYGNTISFSFGLHPVVSLSSKLINTSEAGKDGTTIEKAWNLK